MKLTYKIAGVDIDAADAAVKKIAQMAKATHREGVLGDIGLFGGFFEIDTQKYRRPVLVSSVDGVGTKIKIACAMDQYRGIGQDLVNHCVNDIMCCGAEPLYFLDYLSLGRVEGKAVLELGEGLTAACKLNGCALIGGETAEMPDIYEPGEFDIAGTIVGIVEREAVIDGSRIEKGDVVLGLESDGLHTNGFSLARKIVELSSDTGYHTYYDELEMTIGGALLAVHRSYARVMSALKSRPDVHGFAHITGGGIAGNIRRLLGKNLTLAMNWDAWRWPAIFSLLQKLGEVETAEMRKTFNLGVGLSVIVAREQEKAVIAALNAMDERAWRIGEIMLRTS